MKEKKTRDEVLSQDYMSPQDLKIIMPSVGEQKCRNLINEIRAEMEMKNLFVPQTTPKLALTSMIKKKCGIQ